MFEIADRLIDEAISIREAALLEGINDKYIFKAVVLAGGGGAGKSFIAEKAFNSTGARFINSDRFFEYRLIKNHLPQIMATEPTAYGSDPSMAGDIGGVAAGIADYVYQQQTAHRMAAKGSYKKHLELSLNGMLPLIIDGTARDIDKVEKLKAYLESFGYDVGMLFVNTTLPVALHRNKTFRARVVAEKFVIQAWHQVQRNIPKFKSMFGGDMITYDNSTNLTPTEVKRLSNQLASLSRKLLERPVKNSLGKQITATLRKEGGKYIADLPASLAAKIAKVTR